MTLPSSIDPDYATFMIPITLRVQIPIQTCIVIGREQRVSASDLVALDDLFEEGSFSYNDSYRVHFFPPEDDVISMNPYSP